MRVFVCIFVSVLERCNRSIGDGIEPNQSTSFLQKRRSAIFLAGKLALNYLSYASGSLIGSLLLMRNACGHRALVVCGLSSTHRPLGVVPSPSFVLLIITTSLMTDRRAGDQGKKRAKPSRLRSNKKAKYAF